MTTITDTRTMTDRAVTASADRVLHLARSTGHPWHEDEVVAVGWQGDRGFYTNAAYVLSEPEDWDAVLATVTSVVPDGRPISLISPFSMPDLSDRGSLHVGQPPLMVRASGGPRPAVPAELTITEVDDEVGLEVFERTLIDGYPDPTMQPYRFGDFHDARVLGGSTHLYLGVVAGLPVATAAGHVASGVNLVELVATMPDARGHGYGEALTWCATLVDPALPSVLIASDPGRPVYERMGFVAVSRWTFWHRPA